MDKELLRIAIIATGLIIMVAMVISAYIKDKQAREDDDYYDDEEEFDDDYYDDEEFEEEKRKPSVVDTLKNVYLQKTQQFSKENLQHHHKKVASESEIDEPEEEFEQKTELEKPPRSAAAQSILQFSVITRGHDDFNVADVFHVLETLGLEYGSMKIFERIDENRIVHFGVASMVEPGTFPNENLEEFYCPGVVFFVQFEGLENPVAVFDDYVHTATIFANEMGGQVLDHRRQPLTDAMVNAIRQGLENF